MKVLVTKAVTGKKLEMNFCLLQMLLIFEMPKRFFVFTEENNWNAFDHMHRLQSNANVDRNLTEYIILTYIALLHNASGKSSNECE